MSCDEKLNNEIRAKLERSNIYYGFLRYHEIMDWGWDDYETYILGLAGEGLKLFKKYLRSCYFTSEHLRYICSNISLEAWTKTGLELPAPKIPYETPQLEPKYQEALRKLVDALEKNLKADGCMDITRTSGSDICNEMCGKVFPHRKKGAGHCCVLCDNGPPVPQALEAFKATLAAQNSPFLIPDNLPDDVVEGWEWWRKQEKGNEKCPDSKTASVADSDCDKYCRPIFPECTAKDKEIRGGPGNCPCFRYALRATSTVRAHIEKVLAAQQPKHWIAGSEKEWDVEPWDAWYITGQKRRIVREAIVDGVEVVIYGTRDNHYWIGKTAVSPLPPHNAEPLVQDKYEALEKWRHKLSISCPYLHRKAWNRCGDCNAVFPTLKKVWGDDTLCPCDNFGQPPVLEVADKILAKGPKPKEEEEVFKPYAVVMKDTGQVCKVINKTKDSVWISSRQNWEDQDNIICVTNPDEALRILLDITGQKTMVVETLETLWKWIEQNKVGRPQNFVSIMRLRGAITKLEAEAEKK